MQPPLLSAKLTSCRRKLTLVFSLNLCLVFKFLRTSRLSIASSRVALYSYFILRFHSAPHSPLVSNFVTALYIYQPTFLSVCESNPGLTFAVKFVTLLHVTSRVPKLVMLRLRCRWSKRKRIPCT